MYSRCHVGNPYPSCANSISAFVMLCWCLVQNSSAFTRTSHSCWRCERVLSVRGWTQRFCWPLHCMVSKSPHNRLYSAWTCWCTWCIDPSPRLTTWENVCESGFFFSAYSHCHSGQTHTCCSHIQQSFNCICTFCGKEQEVSYGARRLSGKVGYDGTWTSNHEWSFPVMYLCFHRYRMVH